MRQKIILFFLSLLLISSCLFFLTYQTYGNLDFALILRGKKILAFILVGIACGFSTISFQTLTQNKLLTPNILGIDALYVFIQTSTLFLFASQQLTQTNSLLSFFLSMISMVFLSTSLAFLLIKKFNQNLFLFLMIGMILGTFFNNTSSFMQVLLDPNEYDHLQNKLFANFSNVKADHLLVASILILIFCLLLFIIAPKLDVLNLGNDRAVNLGIKLRSLQLLTLFAISSLVGLSTALVGPTSFLGFISVNITYQMMKTHRHRLLFLCASLVSTLLLIFGEFLVEHLFSFNATLNVIIEFTGGCYFIGQILYERRNNTI